MRYTQGNIRVAFPLVSSTNKACVATAKAYARSEQLVALLCYMGVVFRVMRRDKSANKIGTSTIELRPGRVLYFRQCDVSILVSCIVDRAEAQIVLIPFSCIKTNIALADNASGR